MKRLLILIFILLINNFIAFSQRGELLLKARLKAADTVLLISHKTTEGVTVVDDKTGKVLPTEKLIINDRPNKKIIQEQRIISAKEIDSLSEILAMPNKSSKIEMAMCYIPHHSILIIKNGKTSFIDICFTCQRFNVSKDLRKLNEFDNFKWTQLRNFFTDLGFKYELEKSEKQ